ncbi:hypothetical protein CVU83_01665 [Candidatus Falkowbacteria bacterium HGW-Falkowbacteria-2]|uniref:Uncharacterized protein n=1 Tax=Candidatus Falkowbacteria bacterium HGW-Falkowbacteria-2 TaxID=2013769 RepID=A0A2N2E195_9BACT|nr:MAG: hypothetical protein CVU83_01665 [Candidatus Falkowbacteria bacterium HGW-Falkowbacteria-2]
MATKHDFRHWDEWLFIISFVVFLLVIINVSLTNLLTDGEKSLTELALAGLIIVHIPIVYTQFMFISGQKGKLFFSEELELIPTWFLLIFMFPLFNQMMFEFIRSFYLLFNLPEYDEITFFPDNYTFHLLGGLAVYIIIAVVSVAYRQILKKKTPLK